MNTGLKLINQHYSKVVFAVAVVLITVYCFLPTLLNNYIWIPGDDYQEYLQHLEIFPKPIRYYGAIPAKIIPLGDLNSLRIYYYSTPLLIFIGLVLALRRYNIWAPIISFILLMFMTPVVLQDLEAGTFVGLLGFYLIVIPSISIICKDAVGRIKSFLLLTLGTLFHTSTGMFLVVGYLFARVRSWKDLIPIVAPLSIIAVWALFFQSHATQVLQATNYTYTPSMEPILFIKQYLGISTFTFVCLVGLFLYNTGRLYLLADKFILTLVFLLMMMLALSFFPFFHLNSDRLSKFAVGLIVIIASVALTKGLSDLKGKGTKPFIILVLGTISVISVLLINTFSAQFEYWLSLGI